VPGPVSGLKFSPERLQQSLEELLQASGVLSTAPLSFVVGLSGGVDSVVLLHALSSLLTPSSPDISKPLFKIKAIHVNHQLQSAADGWQSFCVSFCQKLNISIECVSVDATPSQGEGPEAAARNARYAAFKNLLCVDDILLTGHHLDDQIETVFLQMLRGTGVDGAAGIRQISVFNSTYLVRPLLRFSREEIESYASDNNLTWVNDPSNSETKYDRNYLRHEVLPVMEKRWPSYRQTVGRFSQHMRQTSELLKQISEQDYQETYNQKKGCLEIDGINNLSSQRKNNLIRHWINSLGYQSPSDKQLNEIYTVIAAQDDACPVLYWGEAELRRFQNGLYLLNKNREKIPSDFLINIPNWQQGQRVKIPGYGVLELVLSKGEGISPSRLLSENIQITIRKGGERCRPKSRNKSQSLKKIFQEENTPPWLRNNIPIVFIDEQIAAVVGEFYCAPFAVENEMGLKIVHLTECFVRD